MEDRDFLLALQLQEQFNDEATWSTYDEPSQPSRDAIPYSRPKTVSPERPLSIIDESWETIDPSPDVRTMFLEFNDMFFWGKLCGVEVKWSPRMTLCAGVCSYEGRGGLCSIRLSEPILKLRPRRDLVETLLHEMIHALLFVTQNNRDRDGHGPEFCKHMNRINQETGTKISIYHSFHDEVDVYRQHWWRCNGPCQTRKPYFGYVKRAMNRAPAPTDPWWNDHQRSCGGTYTKVKEPEGYGKKGKGKESGGKDGKEVKDTKAQKKPPASGLQDIRNIIAFSGKGFVLGGGSSQPSSSTQKPPWQSPPKPVNIPPIPLASPPRPPPEVKKPNFEQSGNGLKKPSGNTVMTAAKKSIANHSAFVNIKGSPVRVTKTTGQLIKKSADHAKTKLVFQDIFGDVASPVTSPNKTKSTSEKASESRTPFRSNVNNTQGVIRNWDSKSATQSRPSQIPSTSRPFDRPQTSSAGGSIQSSPSGIPSTSRPFNRPQTSGAAGSKFGSVNPSQSRFPKSPQKSETITPGSRSVDPFQSQLTVPKSPQRSGTVTPGSRKRPLDSTSSPPISKYLKTSSSPQKNREPVRQAASSAPSAGPSAVPQPSAPISINQITVNCPVCQTRVPEVEINRHLDSCLSENMINFGTD